MFKFIYKIKFIPIFLIISAFAKVEITLFNNKLLWKKIGNKVIKFINIIIL